MSQSAPLKEFELIARYFSDIGYADVDSSAVALGVGDEWPLEARTASLSPAPRAKNKGIEGILCTSFVGQSAHL